MENESLKNFVNELIKRESESEDIHPLKQLQKTIDELNKQEQVVYMISYKTNN